MSVWQGIPVSSRWYDPPEPPLECAEHDEPGCSECQYDPDLEPEPEGFDDYYYERKYMT